LLCSTANALYEVSLNNPVSSECTEHK